MTTAVDLIEFCESKIGTNYVYGMKGKVLTDSALKELARLYPNFVHYDREKFKIGTVCVDCSGLISWKTGIVQNSTTMSNTAAERGPISSISKQPPGVLVWKQGHVGVYIGGNLCIEAKGSAWGTVCTPLSGAGANSWTHWLRMSYIDLTNSAQANSPPAAGIPKYSDKPILKQGSRGPEVKMLQMQLNRLIPKLLPEPLIEDGIFGPKTHTAVILFQARERLVKDGIVGVNTYRALYG